MRHDDDYSSSHADLMSNLLSDIMLSVAVGKLRMSTIQLFRRHTGNSSSHRIEKDCRGRIHQ